MLNIELTEYGLDDTLRDIKDSLSCVLGKSFSKNYKDCAINRAIGALDAVINMSLVTECELEV